MGLMTTRLKRCVKRNRPETRESMLIYQFLGLEHASPVSDFLLIHLHLPTSEQHGNFVSAATKQKARTMKNTVRAQSCKTNPSGEAG